MGNISVEIQMLRVNIDMFIVEQNDRKILKKQTPIRCISSFARMQESAELGRVATLGLMLLMGDRDVRSIRCFQMKIFHPAVTGSST